MGRSTTKDKAEAAEVIELPDAQPIEVLDGQEEIYPLPDADIEEQDDDPEDKVDDGEDDDWESLTENQRKARLRGRAQQMVLDNHRDEFNDLAKKLFEEKGMVYRRKLTPRERAAQEVRRLIKEHNLRSEFPGFDAAAAEVEPPAGTVVG